MLTTQLLLASCALSGFATENDEILAPIAQPKFAPATQLQADGQPVETEEPGFASPAWYDVDEDGRDDLVVGQFADGKLQVFRGLEGGGFAKGEFLNAGDEPAKVPGVW